MNIAQFPRFLMAAIAKRRSVVACIYEISDEGKIVITLLDMNEPNSGIGHYELTLDGFPATNKELRNILDEEFAAIDSGAAKVVRWYKLEEETVLQVLQIMQEMAELFKSLDADLKRRCLEIILKGLNLKKPGNPVVLKAQELFESGLFN